MAEVERHWFRRIIRGELIRHVWFDEWDFQAAYDAQHCSRTDVVSLDELFRVNAWDCDATLRTVLLHLVHDCARHNGHAALLREGIDGAVGA